MNFALILAAGESRRMGADKLFMSLGDKCVLLRSLQAYLELECIQGAVLVAGEQNYQKISDLLVRETFSKPVTLTLGGKTRGESALNGLRMLPDDCEWVCIHDAARPFVTRGIIENALDTAKQRGSAIASVPVTDTLKRVSEENEILSTVPRDQLRAMQTPQCFPAKDILQAYEQAQRDEFSATDDAAVYQYAGKKVFFSQGSPENIKLTTPDDLALAEFLARKRGWIAAAPRIGSGYDAHRLVEGRALVLGGVTIPHDKGLLGHSDADVLVHAVMDALLGAAGRGDIGILFPDSSAEFKDISSLILLKRVGELLKEPRYRIVNIDCTVTAQRPKLMPYRDEMRKNIAQTLEIPITSVNVKATTTEKMGFEGREEGISASAVALIQA